MAEESELLQPKRSRKHFLGDQRNSTARLHVCRKLDSRTLPSFQVIQDPAAAGTHCCSEQGGRLSLKRLNPLSIARIDPIA